MCCHRSSIMELLTHIVLDIISRVPIKTIIHCRCVCKTWRNLLLEPYFANLHLSRSPTGLIVHQRGESPESDIFRLGDIEDELNHHDIHHDPLMRFDLGLGFPISALWLEGSVNGLLCLWHYNQNDATYICNPITREYILLPDHKYIRKSYAIVTYGFGFISATNQYKVVRVYRGNFPSDPASGSSEGSYKSECEVYTLGTGTWRSLGHVPFVFGGRQGSIFASGNLHWLACDLENINHETLCTFDMEKEYFQLTAPPAPLINGDVIYRSLGLLRGCLCISDNTSESELVIWLMKDYGVKESWTKEFVIQKKSASPDWLLYEMVHVLKVLKDGTILMLWRDDFLFTYHPGTKTFQELDIFRRGVFDTFDTIVHVPSFISLKNFMLESVSVF